MCAKRAHLRGLPGCPATELRPPLPFKSNNKSSASFALQPAHIDRGQTGQMGKSPAHPDDQPTPRSTLRAGYACVLVWCEACRRQREADLQALVDAGRGDVPLIKLRFRCSNCGSRLTNWVVTAKDLGPRAS